MTLNTGAILKYVSLKILFHISMSPVTRLESLVPLCTWTLYKYGYGSQDKFQSNYHSTITIIIYIGLVRQLQYSMQNSRDNIKGVKHHTKF